MSDDAAALKVEVAELRKLLGVFAFPSYPNRFQSTDGGCTEVLLTDESVQLVRSYFERAGVRP